MFEFVKRLTFISVIFYLLLIITILLMDRKDLLMVQQIRLLRGTESASFEEPNTSGLQMKKGRNFVWIHIYLFDLPQFKFNPI